MQVSERTAVRECRGLALRPAALAVQDMDVSHTCTLIARPSTAWRTALGAHVRVHHARGMCPGARAGHPALRHGVCLQGVCAFARSFSYVSVAPSICVGFFFLEFAVQIRSMLARARHPTYWHGVCIKGVCAYARLLLVVSMHPCLYWVLKISMLWLCAHDRSQPLSFFLKSLIPFFSSAATNANRCGRKASHPRPPSTAIQAHLASKDHASAHGVFTRTFPS